MRKSLLWMALCLLGAPQMGCDDESASTRPVVPDAAIPDSAADVTVADMAALPDRALAADAVPVDAAPIMDMAAPDMMPAPDADPIIMPSLACEQDDNCGDFERCLSNLCTLDPRPNVFVVDTVQVTQPMNSAGLLQGALQGVISANQLNLLVEPGGFSENDQYRWYIGNGGFREGTYDYLGVYPIQNFDGFWRNSSEGSLYWGMEGNTPFVLNVPAGQVQAADGSAITCFTSYNTTVALRLEPRMNADGLAEVGMSLSGFLRRSDAEMVNFQFNGTAVALIDLLDDADLNVDTNEDGIPDAYPFNFTGTAAVIDFVGDPPAEDGSNRDPRPNFQNPPECD